MRKDNRKVLSPSDVIRGSRSNNKANLSLDSRVKPENDSTYRMGDAVGWKVAMSVVFCLSAGEALAQCAVPPTCESLGYNKTVADCANAETLKCPFDTSKVFCNTDYTANAKIGDIYYSDGTISDSVIGGKMPIGIVAYVNGKNGLVIALEEHELQWVSGLNTIVSCLQSVEEGVLDRDGKANTNCLLSLTEINSEAAQYCNNFAPGGRKGWYVPSAGELKSISHSYSVLNYSLNKLGKMSLSDDSKGAYNSSTYYCRGSCRPWSVYLINGKMNTYGSSGKGLTRCVLAF